MKRLFITGLLLTFLVGGCGKATTTVDSAVGETTSEVLVEPTSEESTEVTIGEDVTAANVTFKSAVNPEVSIEFDADCDYTYPSHVKFQSVSEGVETLTTLTKVTGSISDDEQSVVASDDYREHGFTVEYVQADKHDYCETSIIANSLKTALAPMFTDDLSNIDVIDDYYVIEESEASVTPIVCGDYTFKLFHNIIKYDGAYTNELPTLDTNVVQAYCKLNNGDYLMVTYAYADSSLFNAELPPVEEIYLQGMDSVTLEDEEVSTYSSSIDLYNSNYENLEIQLADVLSHMTISE